jgi:hypothetical protein
MIKEFFVQPFYCLDKILFFYAKLKNECQEDDQDENAKFVINVQKRILPGSPNSESWIWQ